MAKPSSDFRNSFTYTGREWDKETGLYYYRARYYDPMEGRFISRDPLGFKGGDVNLYGYVGNNPIKYKDPFGLAKTCGCNVKCFRLVTASPIYACIEDNNGDTKVLGNYWIADSGPTGIISSTFAVGKNM